MKSDAKVNSLQTCGESNVKVRCCEAQLSSAQGAFSAKVSCNEARSMKMLLVKAVRG